MTEKEMRRKIYSVVLVFGRVGDPIDVNVQANTCWATSEEQAIDECVKTHSKYVSQGKTLLGKSAILLNNHLCPANGDQSIVETLKNSKTSTLFFNFEIMEQRDSKLCEKVKSEIQDIFDRYNIPLRIS